MTKRFKEKLANTLPPEVLSKIYSSFDVVGDIAIIKAPANAADAEAVAKQIMALHKNVKTVLSQTSPVKGDHRVRELTLLAGENKTVTKYKEAGCFFAVDIEKCYFSPRLKHERLRIASQVSPNETVVNMFAGVGCFSIIIAKTVPQTQVYSIDINPTAYQYMIENVRFNRVFGKVYPILGDSKHLVETKLQGVADRVLMPLPEKALEYLPTAVSALKKTGGWIHYYDFQHASHSEDPREKTEQKVAQKLDNLGTHYMFACSRIIRPTGPNWYQTVLDIQVGTSSSKS
ncbi:MAG TPA: class I SAM-dependent methyltransferase family protein [Candidatus Acidoferrales bacterium]|nr:class I SAM-dependent methyltransferase family protein [Candidatus Acidoferrales bacterium]